MAGNRERSLVAWRRLVESSESAAVIHFRSLRGEFAMRLLKVWLALFLLSLLSLIMVASPLNRDVGQQHLRGG